MSVEKPNLSRVFSDSWRIISSNSRHFLALSSFFIISISIFDIIEIRSWPDPSTPADSISDHGPNRRSIDRSQIILTLLYSLPPHLFNFFGVISITNSISHAFHNDKTLKLSSSLRSIIRFLFPFLATKLIYVLILVAIFFAIVFLMGIGIFGLGLLGFPIEPNYANFSVVACATIAAFFVAFVWLKAEWLLKDASVVVESKWGFAALKRSSGLVKGARGVVFLVVVLFGVLDVAAAALYVKFVRRSSRVVGFVVVVEMVVHAAVFALSGVFSVAAETVLFVHCKAFDGGEVELPVAEKLGQGHVYMQLPVDVEESATL